MRRFAISLYTAALLALVPRLRAGDDPVDFSFFEAEVRPVLVAECYECHSAASKVVRGGLRLDTREGLRAGGDSGPAVVPGKPEESLLLDALRHAGPAMPPKRKLPDEVIADFERWITQGAADPREGETASAQRAGIDIEEGRSFWAYRPPRSHAIPAIRDRDWPRGEIDRFLLAAMEAKGLHPAPDADRATLIRRLSFDLTGLPSTPEEVDSFINDPSPIAYEKTVDRLLASPAFGERWGRHWLDVARFGESLTLRGFVLKDAWRYRDYVIESLNADRPFDEFVREQVAGDLLDSRDLDGRRRRLVAVSFLLLGNTNLEEQDKAQLDMDVVDDQIDVIGRALLAQTIACARCHDHKFDPIPTADYYAIAGILRNAKVLEHANVSKWIDAPLPLPDEQEAAIREHEGRIAAVEASINEERQRGAAGLKRSGPLAAGAVPGIVVDDAQAKRVGDWKASRFSGTYIGDGYLHDQDAGKGDRTLTFVPELPEAGRYEVWLAYSPGGNRAGAVPVTVFSAEGEKTIAVDQRKGPPIGGRFVSLGTYRFERNGQGFLIVSNEGTTGHVIADAVAFVPADQAGGATDDARLRELEAELKRLKASGPRRQTTLGLVEQAPARNLRIHLRGSVHTLGDPAPRGFLRVATAGPMPEFGSDASGRRELAEWLTSAGNPLTARVFANRVWHWLFGAGLVRTVDNFGTTGEPPSHPELLDWLALRLMEDGWSVKALVRRVVLSRAYRQSSISPHASIINDPENRLLSHANRRRLDAECLWDAMLAAADRLDRRMGGPSFPAELAADFGYRDESGRRGVYVPVFRNALPELFEAFDFPDPSLVVGHREASTVAPQALFLLNSPFVIEQARAAAARLLAGECGGDEERVERAFRLTQGRDPTDAERRAVRAVLAEGPDPGAAWAIVFQSLFAAPGFRYVE